MGALIRCKIANFTLARPLVVDGAINGEIFLAYAEQHLMSPSELWKRCGQPAAGCWTSSAKRGRNNINHCGYRICLIRQTELRHSELIRSSNSAAPSKLCRMWSA